VTRGQVRVNEAARQVHRVQAAVVRLHLAGVEVGGVQHRLALEPRGGQALVDRAGLTVQHERGGRRVLADRADGRAPAVDGAVLGVEDEQRRRVVALPVADAERVRERVEYLPGRGGAADVDHQ